MKQIMLPSTILEFTWLVTDGFMEENGLAPPLPKRKLGSPQYRRSTRNSKSSQPLAARHEKNLAPPQKKNLWLGGLYTMEDKDTNTDCQKFVRVGDQKWDIVEITIGIIFFTWNSYSLCFIQGVFKSHLKKITPT